MKTQDDGGPAFPTPSGEHYSDGMSLRDWFAGMVLSSMRVGDWTDCKDGAKYAYNYADAMLAERNK